MFECDCLLNATGRVPNVFGIGLDDAGVDYNNRQGVVIDDFFRFVPSSLSICLLSISVSLSLFLPTAAWTLYFGRFLPLLVDSILS